MSIWGDIAEAAVTPLPVHIVTTGPKAASRATDGASKVLAATERIPQGFVDFTTLPLQMIGIAFDIAWWVLNHLREVFFVLLAAFLLVLFLMLRSFWQGVDARIKDVGKGSRPTVHRRPRHTKVTAHRPNSWVDGQTICVASRSDARKMAKRAGHSDVVMARTCSHHQSSKLWEVQ